MEQVVQPQPQPGSPEAGDHIEQAHGQAQAQFGKLKEMEGKLDKVRLGLTKLAKMGDVVTSEDVIKEAGNLVAEGLDPQTIAGMMADMPENSQALAGWIAKQVQGITQKEGQIDQALAKARGQLGATSLALVAHHAGQVPPAPVPQASGGLALGPPAIGEGPGTLAASSAPMEETNAA